MAGLTAPPRGQDPGEGRGRGCWAQGDPAPSCRFAGGLWGRDIGGVGGLLNAEVPGLTGPTRPGLEVGWAAGGRGLHAKGGAS